MYSTWLLAFCSYNYLQAFRTWNNKHSLEPCQLNIIARKEYNSDVELFRRSWFITSFQKNYPNLNYNLFEFTFNSNNNVHWWELRTKDKIKSVRSFPQRNFPNTISPVTTSPTATSPAANFPNTNFPSH